MATCRRCRFSRLGLKQFKCYVCGQDVCEKCRTVFGYTQEFVYTAPSAPAYISGVPVGGSAGGYVPRPPVYYTVCSSTCFDRWAWTKIAGGQVPLTNGQVWTLAGFTLEAILAQRAVKMYQDHVRQTRLATAKSLVEAEDFEAAAQAYQALGMWKEAGEVRRMARRQVVTQVHVNLNDLIEQLRKAGISTDYTCPACGGHIRISGETSLTKLASCEYCGSVMQTTDLVDFLAKVVGYR